MRRHPQGASRCQHVGVDNTVRLLVLDFMGRFQMWFNEGVLPGTHRYASNVVRELASTAKGTERSLTKAVSPSASAKKIERELALAAAHDAMSELFFVRRKDLDALSASRNGDVPLLSARRRPNR